MATMVKPRTAQQRAVAATRQLREATGLDDLKLLSTAVAELAAEEAARNPAYVSRLQAVYQELVSLHSTRPIRAQEASGVKLVPIGNVAHQAIDPHAPLDPYYLYDLYGPEQLRAALSRYTLARLKEGLPAVEQRNAGTKPASRARKDAIIDYIVEHVAGPGY